MDLMTPKWVIEENDALWDIAPMLEAIKQQGFEHTVQQWKPFEYDDYKRVYPGEQCVIFRGSLITAQVLRREVQWIPGVYYNVPKYTCASYYAHLGRFLLNADYILIPYGDLHRQKAFLYRCVGDSRAVFMRPDRGDKIFTGQVVDEDQFDEAVDRFGSIWANTAELVVVARPKNIKFEWRFVVVEGEIVAGSRYKVDGQSSEFPGYPAGAFEFASEVAKQYDPGDAAWVIDVCRTDNGDYRVVEIGCFSCAGLYCCDCDEVVRAVSAAALKEWESYQCR